MARSLSQLFYALGGSVSPGESNDELIDHLIDAEFIRTPAIQRVFRSVDRGNYYHPNHRHNAYQDLAWKKGNLHLSAPCVYSVVMESLKLKPGHSFLNIGSGSGYLSTMAGLLLGQYGINHGIEFYEEIVDYAYEKLDEFLKNSKVVDEHDFCEPVFTCGNCLTLDSNVQQYDRVYCGAACPEEYENYIKNLVKIDGILIMPLNDKLLKITRVSDTEWNTVKVLSVSFQPLIVPPVAKKGEVIPYSKLSDIKPPTLQQLCRFKIRSHLRNNIEAEHPKLIDNKKKLPTRRSGLKLFVVNYGDDDDMEDSDSDAENLDSFSLLMRSLHRTSYLLRSFHTIDNLSPNEQSETEAAEEEEIEEVLKFASLTTVQDAFQQEEDKSGDTAKKADESGESSSKSEKKAEEEPGETSKAENSPKSEKKAKSIAKAGSSSAEMEPTVEECVSSKTRSKRGAARKLEENKPAEMSEAKSNPKAGKRSKSVAKAGSSSVEAEATSEASVSSKTRSKVGTARKVEEDKDSSFDLPPSRSTRSKTNALKRKQSALDEEPSTSAGPSSSKAKKSKAEGKRKASKATFNHFIKFDSDNRIVEDFSHTYFLTQRIAELPLPISLRKFVNYKREHF